MSYSCPLNFEQVDSNISRISSFIVASLVITYAVSLNIFILYFLFLDFVNKLFFKKEYSPIAMLALFIKKLFRIKNKYCDGAAKRLATYFGLLFIFLLIVTSLFDFYILSLFVLVTFLSCSFLDAFFNYCLGCKIYYISKKFFPNLIK